MDFSKVYGPDDLEQMAGGLSNYGGQSAAMIGYDGQGDEALDFDGQSVESFVGEGNGGREFTFTIDNNNTTQALRLKILSGYNDDVPAIIPVTSAAVTNVLPSIIATMLPAGQIRDGYTPDLGAVGTGSGDGLVVSSNSIKTVNEFLRFIKHNPTRVVGMAIRTDNELQVAIDFTVKELSPFKDTQSYSITPKKFQNQGVFQSKILQFATPGLQLDPNTEIFYSVLANTQVAVTFYCGASLNMPKVLKSKAKLATNNIVSAGGAQNVLATKAKLGLIGGGF